MSATSAINYLFILIALFIGLVTSYQDFRYGKIKNKWIVFGLILGLGGYFLIILLALPTYFLKVFINSVIALLVGFFIWRLKLWSAGDAKLFALFAFLLPLEFYQKSYLPYFPSLALLINIFIPILLFCLIKDTFYFLKLLTNFRNLKKNFKEWLITKKIHFDAYFKKSQFQKMPFAFWMLIGVILTIFLKGSLISIFFNLWIN